MRDGIKRQTHMNPTDNEDDKTKGREKEIKRLNNRSARAVDGIAPLEFHHLH